MKRFGIRLGIAVGLALAVVALVAATGEARKKKGKTTWAPTDRAFNHKAHDKMVKAKGLTAKCDKCHKAKADGTLIRPFRASRDHARCAAKCHGGNFRHHKVTKRETGSVSSLKRLYRSNKGRVCFACHSLKKKIQPTNGLSEVNNKPSGTVDMVASYSHKKHTRPGSATGRQCEMCHGKFGSGSPKNVNLKAAGHKLCANCHERGMEPLMNECGGCHIDKNSKRGKNPVMRPRGKNKYATTRAFDHDRHARENRVGTQGRECLTCHSNIKDAKDDSDVPLPTMQDCYKSCHNGKKAFDATGAMCTRCHQGGRK